MQNNITEIKNIGIVGIGIVGNAIYNFFKNKYNCIAYDKYKSDKSVENILSVLETDIIFLCLPTPWNGATLDDNEIIETLNFLEMNKYNGYVIIKSTVLIGSCKTYSENFDLKIIHNPEFLSEANSVNDFATQDFIILGYTKNTIDNKFGVIYDFFNKNFYQSVKQIKECNSDESESVKLMSNAFYAIKTQIFTEYYLFCEKKGLDYNNILNMILTIGFINPTHTTVPYVNNIIGFHGTCLPKDTHAMNKVMKDVNTYHKMTESALLERDEIMNDIGLFIDK